MLLLEDEQGRGRPVSGADLGVILHDARTLRLAVLNACEGARTSASDPFAGTAQSLVQQGIPAVIAMQFEITDEAAITFAQSFYAALVDGYPVDAALAEARKAIFARGTSWSGARRCCTCAPPTACSLPCRGLPRRGHPAGEARDRVIRGVEGDGPAPSASPARQRRSRWRGGAPGHGAGARPRRQPSPAMVPTGQATAPAGQATAETASPSVAVQHPASLAERYPFLREA